MRSKRYYTLDEINEMRRILPFDFQMDDLKKNRIKRKLKKFKFYISDFNRLQFTQVDLENLIQDGVINII